MKYGRGERGLPVDQAKCIDLYREAAVLGHPRALFQLGNFYHKGVMGLEQNDEEALKYWEKAAEGGDIRALSNVACAEAASYNRVAAMRHWRLSASGGYRKSMDALINLYFGEGFLNHCDLAETLQAFYRAQAEMKNEGRDKYIAALKITGKYKDEDEC
jgi:TPR repeat protein